MSGGDNFSNFANDNNALGGPEVRPDGRPPRVKSDILAKKKNKQNRFFNKRPVVTSTPSPFHLIPRDEVAEEENDLFAATTPVPPPPFQQTQRPPQSFPRRTTLSPFIANTRRPQQEPFESSTLSPFISNTERPPGAQFRPIGRAQCRGSRDEYIES